MIDKKYIQELADLLDKNELTEISVIDGDKSVLIKKEKTFAPPPFPQITASTVTSSGETETLVCTPVEVKKGKPVTSPMVGTFYRASSPDADPFVEVGEVIKEGQVVCIIEAMKLMNEIESDAGGKVVEICVENGQPVEFGQVLMYVE
ncbi:MAG: acetyl-CoA carboxylase biotin carboxyl carrier protein [Candidatus Gastranaerophilales bacterium]|nr:acetyl-CoA carboxylase biotin carboxyl carrier protein [Candidatus Gastranaerophilales bacterium]